MERIFKVGKLTLPNADLITPSTPLRKEIENPMAMGDVERRIVWVMIPTETVYIDMIEGFLSKLKLSFKGN